MISPGPLAEFARLLARGPAYIKAATRRVVNEAEAVADSRPIASMTGFARQEGGDGTLNWTWEIRSVNGRSLDLRCRVPPGFEKLEIAARAEAPKYCTRGNLQINLTVARAQAPTQLQVNRELLDQLIAICGTLTSKAVAPPRLDGLLTVRGVVEVVEEEDSPEQAKAREAAMTADLEAALEALVGARRAEGARLGVVIAELLDTMTAQVEQAAAIDAVQPDALRARLKSQVEELLQAVPALPEDRLAQEAALLAAKADTREELDRLRAHLAAARELLAEGAAMGRRLDFLCQEFNREANTLCSKSPDVELTRIGLELKTSIDRLREQVQNIE
jgi:uncharacterized protein (TIGR00255 family)